MLGDSYGAGIVYHLSKKELDEQDRLKALEMEESGLEDKSNDKHGRIDETSAI